MTDEKPSLSKRIRWRLTAAAPRPIQYWRELLRLPFKKIAYKDIGVTPDEWEKEGFLCLCNTHIDSFGDDADVATTVMGYYVCDMKGCGKTATRELLPNLRKTTEQFVNSGQMETLLNEQTRSDGEPGYDASTTR